MVTTIKQSSPQLKQDPDVNGQRKIDQNAANRAIWELRLYVAGMTPADIRALDNLKSLCEEHLCGLYEIQVIDLLEKPTLATVDQIIAVPTLVRRLPAPVKKIIGDLSNTDRVLIGLDLRPAGR